MPLFTQEKLSVPTTSLRDRYLVPPFSILDSQVGEWLKNRNEWEQIIQNRDSNIRNVTIKRQNTPYINALDYDEGYKGLERNGQSSTFDPFLCEILVKWFSRPGDNILDPFAGGHIRGAVSCILGRGYSGVDINPLQVEANNANWENIGKRYDLSSFKTPNWIVGDSSSYMYKDKYNMMLTCPPYFDLEVYTDNPRDLSNQGSYEEFKLGYQQAIHNCYNALEDCSFAVIVVEELRDKNGLFYGFVPDTIDAFRQCGFKYYNEMILENRIMSLGVRCPKYFEQSRKVGRHHQNVLVFFKGNPKDIEKKFGKFQK